MSRFKRGTEIDTVRADWWDSGTDNEGNYWEENVSMRPVLGYEMQQKATRAGLKPPPGISMDAFQKADAFQVLQWSDELSSQKLLMKQMITEWNFFYEPNEEQAALGTHGDKVPFNDTTVAELSREDFEYIMEEINKRGRSVKAKAEADSPGFRPDVPVEDGVEGEVPAHDI